MKDPKKQPEPTSRDEKTPERKPSPPRKPTTGESVAVRSLRSGSFASKPESVALGIRRATRRTSSEENRPANVSQDATLPDTQHSQLSRRARDKARAELDEQD